MSTVAAIKEFDRSLFLTINGAHSPMWDAVMSYASNMLFWFPVYVAFLIAIQRRFEWRGFLWSLPVIAVMIWCSDSGSVMLFKETVQRLRPCHAEDLRGLVHIVDGNCGGAYGFVSSHASNHFAIAVFMSCVLRSHPRMLLPAVLLLWASFICYSRVYLGVHYPLDVAVGALYGAFVGFVFFRIHRAVIARFTPTT